MNTLSIVGLLIMTIVAQIPSFSLATRTAEMQDYIEKCCQKTLYKDLCSSTLSKYASTIKYAKPNEVANAAVKVCVSKASSLSKWVKQVKSQKSVRKGDKAALSDCVQNLSSSASQLKSSLSEIKKTKKSMSRFQRSNIQSWLSAALTNVDSCLSGFQDQEESSSTLYSAVQTKVQDVCHLISNALAIFNQYEIY